MARPPLWAVGVTTCPQRRDSLLPRTLASLKAAGWPAPRLFVDGARSSAEWADRFGLEVTARFPVIRTYCSWVLGLAELYAREPVADFYFMGQDDFVTYRNLRAYLEKAPCPARSYKNCFSFRENESIIAGKPPGWYEACTLGSGPTYHGKPAQAGRGAVALVFNNEGVRALLASEHIILRPKDSVRGHRGLDGAIVTAMNKAGYREFCHAPSLVQHLGAVSSMGSAPQRQALSFMGEQHDALTFLEGRPCV